MEAGYVLVSGVPSGTGGATDSIRLEASTLPALSLANAHSAASLTFSQAFKIRNCWLSRATRHSWRSTSDNRSMWRDFKLLTPLAGRGRHWKMDTDWRTLLASWLRQLAHAIQASVLGLFSC
jgi:hypothetical protein